MSANISFYVLCFVMHHPLENIYGGDGENKKNILILGIYPKDLKPCDMITMVSPWTENLSFFHNNMK